MSWLEWIILSGLSVTGDWHHHFAYFRSVNLHYVDALFEFDVFGRGWCFSGLLDRVLVGSCASHYLRVTFTTDCSLKNSIIYWLFFGFRKWKLHRKSNKLPREEPYPPVSILKPLTGVDPNLFSNLETFFTMHYPVVKTKHQSNSIHSPSI